MDIAARSWLATGVAFVGAGAVAFAPITPSSPVPELRVTAPIAVSASPVELAAVDWPYILSLPIVRQMVVNWAENWVVYLGGFAQAGIGLAESLIAIPGVTVEIIEQLVALDFVGAFDTFTEAVRDSVVAVGQPLLDSWIWRYQKALLVDVALTEALPQAFIDVVNGFLTAGGGVTTALIQGTQDFVAAVLTLNLTNIVDAAVDGTRNFVVSLGDGARSIIDGIESAQLGISTALATDPPVPPTFADVDSPAVESTMAESAVTVTVDTEVATEDPAAVSLTEPDPESGRQAVESTESDTEAEELEQDAPAEDADEPVTEDLDTAEEPATETDSQTAEQPSDSAANEEKAESPAAEPASDSEAAA